MRFYIVWKSEEEEEEEEEEEGGEQVNLKRDFSGDDTV
jgi:hypothetical protein